jgi:hypothetical protein
MMEFKTQQGLPNVPMVFLCMCLVIVSKASFLVLPEGPTNHTHK